MERQSFEFFLLLILGVEQWSIDGLFSNSHHSKAAGPGDDGLPFCWQVREMNGQRNNFCRIKHTARSPADGNQSQKKKKCGIQFRNELKLVARSFF